MAGKESKPTTKIVFGKETVVDQNTKYKHKKSGDILTFVNWSDKPFQKVPLSVYKRVSDGELFEYTNDEVERLTD